MPYTTPAGKQMSRTYFVSLNDNNNFEIISSQEKPNGFYTHSLETALNLFSTLFTFMRLNLTHPHLQLIALVSPQCSTSNCSMVDKFICVLNDCAQEAHTGNYVFSSKDMTRLAPIIRFGNSVSADESKRKYKAMVWVHTTSPAVTELVVKTPSGED